MTLPIICVLAIFLGVSCLIFWVACACDPYRKEVRSRVNEIAGDAKAAQSRDGSRVLIADGSWLQRLTEVVGGKDLPARLAQAGFYREMALVWFGVAALSGAATVLAIGGFVQYYWNWGASVPLGLLVLSVAGMAIYLPRVWLHRAIAKRHKMLRKAIPDLLELMIVCMDAGLSLPYTLKRVTNELQLAHPELATELHAVQRETEMGASFSDALNRFAQRSNFEGLKALSVLVREANRFGSDIIESLRDQADLMRLQRELLAEEMAQKAAVKILLPILMCILPSVFVVVAGPAFIQLTEAFSK